MERFQNDFKSYTAEQVEKEVDKFMMDAENVNMYIKYLKDRKENPEKYAMEALEAELSLYVYAFLNFFCHDFSSIPF